MKEQGDNRYLARLPRGFRDVFSSDVAARGKMIETVREVYERYGFSALETPAVEYLETLGKYLPESDTPAGGIFAFRDDDGSRLALRYDLTAPLSRVFAQYRADLPLPFRRYQAGPVWRDEKPGPDRFREFFQFDIDTVGTASMAADVELCCALADSLEALGVERGKYLIRVNNRKLMNGLLEVAGIPPSDEARSLSVLRAIDKLERLGLQGVRQLLGKGRVDESGDFTRGADLSEEQIQRVVRLLSIREESREKTREAFEELVRGSSVGEEGVAELAEIDRLLRSAGYLEDRVIFDPTIVRGLAYYTGPVFEASLTFEVEEDGERKKVGSVAGGGRYDNLIPSPQSGNPNDPAHVPATGVSIGVDRLLMALKHLGKQPAIQSIPPVVVTVMDKNALFKYQEMTFQLRREGIPAEMYLGSGGFRKQLAYADQRGSIVAVIAGSNEFEAGQVSLKDLWLGRELSKEITERADWVRDRPAQVTVLCQDLVTEVKAILARYGVVV